MTTLFTPLLNVIQIRGETLVKLDVDALDLSEIRGGLYDVSFSSTDLACLLDLR
jgi:hypothetical protein